MPFANFSEPTVTRPLEELLDIPKVAKILGISVDTVKMWVLNRSIEFIKVGSRVMFHPQIIQEFIATGTRKPIN